MNQANGTRKPLQISLSPSRSLVHSLLTWFHIHGKSVKLATGIDCDWGAAVYHGQSPASEGERKKKKKKKEKPRAFGARTWALPHHPGLFHENYTIAPFRVRLKTSLIPLSTFLKFYQQLISSLSWVNCFSSPKFATAQD
jgi:hypothetical protein